MSVSDLDLIHDVKRAITTLAMLKASRERRISSGPRSLRPTTVYVMFRCWCPRKRCRHEPGSRDERPAPPLPHPLCATVMDGDEIFFVKPVHRRPVRPRLAAGPISRWEEPLAPSMLAARLLVSSGIVMSGDPSTRRTSSPQVDFEFFFSY